MKKICVAALVAALSACTPPTVSNEQAAASDAAADNLEAMADNLEMMADDALAEAGGAKTEASTGWVYTQDEDKMRGGTNKVARVEAAEPIRLPFPYGESTPTLNIRQDTKWGFDIFLSANGQFLCRVYNNDTISVKFDSGPVREWACADADGGSSDIVFVRQAKRFLAELKKAKEVTIEAPMYEAGRQQMTFKVEGLKW